MRCHTCVEFMSLFDMWVFRVLNGSSMLYRNAKGACLSSCENFMSRHTPCADKHTNQISSDSQCGTVWMLTVMHKVTTRQLDHAKTGLKT